MSQTYPTQYMCFKCTERVDPGVDHFSNKLNLKERKICIINNIHSNNKLYQCNLKVVHVESLGIPQQLAATLATQINMISKAIIMITSVYYDSPHDVLYFKTQ